MPWKQDYTISDEIAVRDGTLVWPGGSLCCFSIVVDLSPATAGGGICERDLRSPTCHYGMNEGLEAILALLARLGLRATFATPALVAELHPGRVAEIVRAGHEIAANGLLGEDLALLDGETERRRLRQATQIMHSITGSPPSGWFALPRPGDAFATGNVSSRTVDLLIDAGYGYFGNGLADDAPHYWVTDFETRKSILALPYYYHFDDRFFLMFPHDGTGLERPGALLRNWRAELQAQYRRKRCFSLTISPARSGWGHRLDMLDRFLGEAVRMPGLWNATGAEIAAYWASQYPAADHLRLEPSIWQSHEGSLD